MPKYKIHVPTYKALEGAGALKVFAALEGEVVIGFITVLTHIMAHYSAKLSYVESYYVLPEYRRRGAGLALLRMAERHAYEIGSNGLFVSAPYGSKLAQLLPKTGYAETNRTFFRKIGDE